MNVTIDFNEVAAKAGFVPDTATGRLNLPATQAVASALNSALVSLLPTWTPGAEPVDLTLTGAGPVWAYMSLGHAVHGTVRSLKYVAPNTPGGILVFQHGTTE